MKRAVLPMLVLSTIVFSQALVNIHPYPEAAVAGLGGIATFTCLPMQQPEKVEWLINGTAHNSTQHSRVIAENQVQLLFYNVSAEYNNTRIQCRVDHVLSETATLLVQGRLASVDSLHVDADVAYTNNTILLRWTAPFTLDIQLSPVDITYCVDVTSSAATLHSECGINETKFTYPLPPRSWCHEYNITVTPVNTAGNGTATRILFHLNLAGPVLTEVTFANITDIILQMSAPVCDAELRIVDLDTGKSFTLGDFNVSIAGTNIIFSVLLLHVNRHYDITIMASNIAGNATSNVPISTHDITSCAAHQDDGILTVLVNYTENSNATGALLNFIFINEDGVTTDYEKSFCVAADRIDVSQGLTLPLNMWFPGRYMLYAYDIESNKMISNGPQYQASNGSFKAINGLGTTPLPKRHNDCSISTGHGSVITVECPSLKSFLVWAQHTKAASVNVLYVNTSMDSQTLVTLEVPESGEYLVTVVPVQDGMGILHSETFKEIIVTIDAPSDLGMIAGIIILSIVLVLLLAIILLLYLKTRHHKATKVYIRAEIRGHSETISVCLSKFDPLTTTSQNAEPQYAMMDGVSSQHFPAVLDKELVQDSSEPQAVQDSGEPQAVQDIDGLLSELQQQLPAQVHYKPGIIIFDVPTHSAVKNTQPPCSPSSDDSKKSPGLPSHVAPFTAEGQGTLSVGDTPVTAKFQRCKDKQGLLS